MSASTDNSKLGRRKRETFLDKTFNRVLMEVVGPILIIAMIGALVFFLIEIFYRGPHSARLGWVLGLFTIASVLVSRISIEAGIERALMFGSMLALATFIVTLRLVDFEYGNFAFLEPLVVICFITIVMWCANRLTWDCTMIDQSRDVSSIGLTELIKRKISRKQRKQTKQKPVDEPAKSPSPGRRLLFALFANSSTKNTPGLWVFYFAIAAFPIFGFGQWFAQPSAGWGYRWIFFLFAVYLGSGLGLLMLTSLLGLERYVNKRGAELPGIVSRTWIVVGTLFALGVMLVMLALPSPSISNGLENALAFLTTNVKATSKHAVGKDGQKKGENPNNEKVDNQAKDGPKRDGDKGEAKGNGKDGKQSGDGKSKSKGKDSSRGKGKSGKSQSGKNQNGKNQKGDSKSRDNSSDKSPSKNKADQRSGDKKDAAKNPNNEPGKKPQRAKSKNEAKKAPEQNRQQDKKANQERRQEQANNPPPKQNQANNRGNRKPAPAPKPSGAVSSIGKSLSAIIKFLVYGVGLVALLFALWLFRDELAKFWNELFGSREADEKEKPVAKEKKLEKPLPGFKTFREPFASGMAAKWKPAQTIQYTFQALEAWARGYQQPRDQDVTPHEFARQLSAVNEELAAEARQLADLHGRSLFSEDSVVPADASQLKRIWQLMASSSPR